MTNLQTSFELDRRWHWLRGDMQAPGESDNSKQPALECLASVLDAAGVPYAVISGVAAQVHLAEPRTTLDIDVALGDRGRLPVAALEAAGFRRTGVFIYTENWSGPAEVPVQFTDDPELHGAVLRAVAVPVGATHLRVIAAADLLLAKLRACRDSARRRSKRIQDLADVEGLIEAHPELDALLTGADRELLARF